MRYSAYQWQRATRVALPGGLIRRELFDAFQRNTRFEVGTAAEPRSILDHRYSYSAVGNITEKETLAGATTYGYDALDRLTQATPPPQSALPSEAYSYDPVHNRTSSAHQPGPWAYNANNELTAWGIGPAATANTYDANGNLTREQTGANVRTYSYDVFDRLIEVADNGQAIARYAYDPFARRVKKEVIAAGTTTITWSLNIQRGLIAEYAADGQLQADYQWEAETPWSTGPVAQRTRSNGQMQSHTIHVDHLWTPVALTDAQGALAWRAQHEAFGTPLIEAGATVQTPWRFPGQYADAETGFSQNLWRYYNSQTGRYTQSDPIGLEGGINMFAYANSQPTRNIDPTGEFPWFIAGCLAGVATEIWGKQFPRHAREWRCYDFSSLATACLAGSIPVSTLAWVARMRKPVWSGYFSVKTLRNSSYGSRKPSARQKYIRRRDGARREVVILTGAFVIPEYALDIVKDTVDPILAPYSREMAEMYVGACPKACDED